MTILKSVGGGVEWRVSLGSGSREGDNVEEEIKREEIRDVVRRLKEGKAVG